MAKKVTLLKIKQKKLHAFNQKKSFQKFVDSKLTKILFSGEIFEDYFNISDHEFIMLIKKL